MKAIITAALLATGLAATAPAQAVPLPNLHADATQTSVSGLSSGAYMAGQFHVAYSASLIGVGIVAGGPYYCAQGSLTNATTSCLYGLPTVPTVTTSVNKAKSAAAAGQIDPLSNLVNQKVYIYTGTQDFTVYPKIVDLTNQFYVNLGVPAANISYVKNIASGHAFITTNFGNSCGTSQTPYVNNCNYDQAGAILTRIYGTLNARVATPTGQTLAFDQTEFLASATTHGLATTGYAYIPSQCSAGTTACRVHVVFHGCQQNATAVKDAVYAHAGYNNWADNNNFIMVYPQTTTLGFPTNNNGCWDWWAYDDANYYAKNGRQMAAVNAMIKRLTGQ